MNGNLEFEDHPESSRNPQKVNNPAIKEQSERSHSNKSNKGAPVVNNNLLSLSHIDKHSALNGLGLKAQ